MIKNRSLLLFVTLLLLLLGACSNNNEENMGNKETDNDNEKTEETEEMNHGEMNHSSSGEVPEGLEKAEDPTYPVGNKAILQADHMPGMKGAEAVISGAYDTVVYTVTYTPSTGGEKVKNHKWVIHEEFEDPGEEPYKPGDEVVLNADHMKGMDGAAATIDSAEEMTVYMVDYTPTDGGEKVRNHKWVTESELSPAE
ncbi:YdhK family protein [Bacillus haikouensis]|uniref:YdhK family protein n=1 Tax=Bacillus haikouensis TaxID=1510468 RepID=UPI0015566BB8|nr:YdhK family protein [Bacillus haikouensis]NQD68788.1 YdhK family protein [Bacillus haikouensis]